MKLINKFSCFLVLSLLSILNHASTVAHAASTTQLPDFKSLTSLDGRLFPLPAGFTKDESALLLSLFFAGMQPITTSSVTPVVTTTTTTSVPATTVTTAAATAASNSSMEPTTNSNTAMALTTEEDNFHISNTTKSIFVSVNATMTTTAMVQTTETPRLDLSECAVFPACTVSSRAADGWPGIGVTVTCHRSLAGLIAGLTIVLAVAVVFSNLVIIVVVLRSKSLRTPHGYFKMSLAAADLISGSLVLPPVAYNILSGIFFDRRDEQLLLQVSSENPVAATVFGTAGILTSVVSIFSLLLLAVDSFMTIRWPIKSTVGDVMTVKRACAALAFVWMLGIVLSVLPILAKDYLEYELHLPTLFYVPVLKPQSGVNTSVFQRYLPTMVYAIVVWGLPFLMTWCIIIMTSVQSHKVLQKMRHSRKGSVRSLAFLDKLSRGVRRTVVVVLALFTFTVLPAVAVLLYVGINAQKNCLSRSTGVALFIAFCIHFCGNFLNVIVYNVCNKQFREECYETFVAIARTLLCKSCPISRQLSKSHRRSAAYWQSAAGRSLWRERYGAKPSTSSSSELRTLSGTSTSSTSTNGRSKSISSLTGHEQGRKEKVYACNSAFDNSVPETRVRTL